MPLNIISPAKLLRFTHPFYFHAWPPVLLGVIFLALTRDYLFKYEVHDYNTPEALNYRRPEPCGEYCNSCNPTELRFRTYDGHCNNLNQTGMGMKNHRFGRSAVKDPKKRDPGLLHPDPYL